MPWVCCIKEIESGKFIIVTEDMRIDADDPRYGEDVHIVPVEDDQRDPEWLTFGIHEPKRECVCQPKIEEQCYNRTLVKHRDLVN